MAQASALVGKQVAVSGDTLTADRQRRGDGAFSLASAAQNATVTILSPNGTVAGTVDLGALSAGQQSFTWSNGAAGTHIQLQVNAAAGIGRARLRHALQRLHGRGRQHVRHVADPECRRLRDAAARLIHPNRSRRYPHDIANRLSGLLGAQTGLNTVSNDLANASTTAFKSQTALFEDVYPGESHERAGDRRRDRVDFSAIFRRAIWPPPAIRWMPRSRATAIFSSATTARSNIPATARSSSMPPAKLVTATGASVLGYPVTASGSPGSTGADHHQHRLCPGQCERRISRCR